MSNITKTITIEIAGDLQDDDLIQCIMYLKVLAKKYSRTLDIAYAAIEREYNLPPEMIAMEQPQ